MNNVIVQKFFLWLFKKRVIRSLRKSGFLVDNSITVNQLHRFFFKCYEDGSTSCTLGQLAYRIAGT